MDNSMLSSSFPFIVEAIRIPTVSYSETELNTTALREFYGLMRKGAPLETSSERHTNTE